MPIITDNGFSEDEPVDAIDASDLPEAGEGLVVSLAADGDPSSLQPAFNRIAMIIVPFPNFSDGRGFSLAQRLRALGYRGNLRASGHVITDQYPFARFCGFDEVQIDDALAARQTEDLWMAAKDRPVPPFLRRRAIEWIASGIESRTSLA